MDKPATWSFRLLYCLLFVQFLTQFVTFFYFHGRIARIESTFPDPVRIQSSQLFATEDVIRRKRSSALPATEDNAVSDIFRVRDDKELLKESKKVTTSSTGSVPPTASGGHEWVWLTADTRIPYEAIDTFCRKSSEYCPPGLPGAAGTPGIPGDRGLPGQSGLPGPEGPPGLPGYPGARGPKGEPGPPGLDGRDGIPGEPGLDGVPGRSGLDGLPGVDGTPGLNGIPGLPGKDGIDGKQGERGPMGPPGLKGDRGSPGPRGFRGLAGKDGLPGKPGIVAYEVKSNGSSNSKLLVPPSIAGGGQRTQLIDVKEGVNVRLQCTAHGNPRPIVHWFRTNGTTIPIGSWHVSSVVGSTFNITSVTRDYMGEYTCVANNGIPPSVNQTFKLNVHFPPFIRIRNRRIRVSSLGTAVLECEVEAFPEPDTYWERGDGRLLNESEKYHIKVYDKRDVYKLKMQLQIRRVLNKDHGIYHCVARNGIDETKGIFEVRGAPHETNMLMEKHEPAVFGKPPPPKVDFQDKCPPQVNCDACPNLKCAFPDIARPLAGVNFTGLTTRTVEGVPEAVGKPVYKCGMDDFHAAWMHDASPKSDAVADKLWVTRRNNTSIIYEYNKNEDFNVEPPREIKLPYPFKGNGHVVYNGSFFYNPENKSSIVRVDLPTTPDLGIFGHNNNVKEMKLPGLLVNTSNYLYTPKNNFNYVDFDVDENGLWVIYGLPSNSTVVMKVDPVTMTAQYAWNISVDHHKFGEMFIARGVLYAVHNVTSDDIKIRLALDLYRSAPLDVNLSFSNPFHRTTMMAYNYRTKELYTCNQGKQLAYPVKYAETGYIMPKEDGTNSAEGLNGFDVYNQ